MRIAGGYDDKPTLVDGRLFFRDSKHLADYTDFLNSAITIPAENTDTVDNDPDDILDAIESELGFTSLRHITNEQFEKLNEVGWDRLEYIPEKHFINSLLTKSVLNRDAQVQIGDSIVYFISKDFAAVVDVKNIEVLTEYQKLDKDVTLDEVLSVDRHSVASAVCILRHTMLEMANLKVSNHEYEISSGTAYIPDECISPLRIVVPRILYTKVGTGSDFEFEYEIEWGDGTVETGTGNAPSNVTYAASASHTYSTAGTYHVKMKGRRSANHPWDGEKEFDVTVPGGCHYEASKSSNEEWHAIQYTNKAIKGKCWVEQWKTMFGPYYKLQIGASTDAMKYENNKWKRHRAERVVVQYQTNEYTYDCSSSSPVGGASWPYNSNSACAETQATSVNARIGWFSMTSNHKMRLSNNYYEFDVTITPCD